MKSTVIDANVIIKWLFPERVEEDHLPQALNVLNAVKQNVITVVQPPHWLAEVAAVTVRLQPKIVTEAINLLCAMQFPVIEEPEVYDLACQLSHQFNHHVFDTLYHAVALYRGNTQFITSDEKYYRKAVKKGGIVRLADFSIYDH